MKIIRLIRVIVAISGWVCVAGYAAPAPSRWEQPAAALAEQIAGILGPGQARLTIRNLSSIPTDEIPNIEHLLEQDLKAHGVTPSGDESANTVRVTLSESARQRVWVAEVAEGDQTQVAMVELAPDQPAQTPVASGLLLRKDMVVSAHAPILSALEIANSLVALEADQIVLYARAADGWQEEKRASMPGAASLGRDPRGILRASADGTGFEAWLAGMHCTGGSSSVEAPVNWAVQCSASDDPWPVAYGNFLQPPAQVNISALDAGGIPALKAFYNAMRNYFTGVISPSLGVELPAFYSGVLLPRPAGNAVLLIAGIDGEVQLVGNGRRAPVAGARDWGSDLGVLRSGCGSGTQIIASSSGEAASDSLRAYELPAFEAVPVSAPLAIQGTVTAIWPAADSKSVYIAVRTAASQYEVDRVSALCN